MGEWAKHGSSTGGYYKCNKFEEDKAAGKTDKKQEKIDDVKSELSRYMFYFERA